MAGVFPPWLRRLSALDEKDFLGIVNRVPTDWMTAVQKDFCLRFLSVTHSELKKLSR